MADYIQIVFEFLDNEQTDVIVALLSEMDYEGFVEEGDLLKAYISENLFDEKKLRDFGKRQGLTFSVSKLEARNWNEEWESNFHPVVINHAATNVPFAGIRASFHQPLENAPHQIVINPKMSFGTGHHATTAMMIRTMSTIDFSGRKVLDFGTGTGILAILSEKLGARHVVAIDIDNQSIENSSENYALNSCSRIELVQASSADCGREFNIILANIVRKVILDNLSAFVDQLKPGGIILLSGLLKDDEKEIVNSAIKHDLVVDGWMQTDEWICLRLSHRAGAS